MFPPAHGFRKLRAAEDRPRSRSGKKVRAKNSAKTALTPVARMALGAIALPEEQPKFRPATMRSPGCTFCGNSGLADSRTCRAISATSRKTTCVGVILSVGMLWPNFQQVPSHTKARFLIVQTLGPPVYSGDAKNGSIGVVLVELDGLPSEALLRPVDFGG